MLKRLAQGVGALVAFFLLALIVDGWQAFGTSASGERRERMQAASSWTGSGFDNPQRLSNDAWKMVTGLLDKSPHGSPSAPIDVHFGDSARFEQPPASGLRVTWFGHSTLLIELDGHRILTDPVFSDRVSPVPWFGPRRWYPPPVALSDLPPVDVVLISHDHYDHLDHPTIRALRGNAALFIVPLGVGAHLQYWGIPAARIVELDWWEETRVGQLRVACTPARHASGRALIDNNATLWASYALLGAKHRVYFSGDTGLFPALTQIGDKYGPFDLTLIEAGAYDSAWPDWHLGPEQAVRAHRMVRGNVMMAIHWGLFDLAYHGWTEPIERVLAAARTSGVTVVAPRPGHSIEPTSPPPLLRWWPEVPWTTGEQDPIRATLVP